MPSLIKKDIKKPMSLVKNIGTYTLMAEKEGFEPSRQFPDLRP